MIIPEATRCSSGENDVAACILDDIDEFLTLFLHVLIVDASDLSKYEFVVMEILGWITYHVHGIIAAGMFGTVRFLLVYWQSVAIVGHDCGGNRR